MYRPPAASSSCSGQIHGHCIQEAALGSFVQQAIQADILPWTNEEMTLLPLSAGFELTILEGSSRRVGDGRMDSRSVVGVIWWKDSPRVGCSRCAKVNAVGNAVRVQGSEAGATSELGGSS